MKLILEVSDLNEHGKRLFEANRIKELTAEHFRVQRSTIYNSNRVTFEHGQQMKVLKDRG